MMKKVINLLTLLVMVSANTITPFTYADIETGDVVDIEETTIIEEPENEISEENNNIPTSGDIQTNEEPTEVIEPELPIISTIESGNIAPMSGLNNDIDIPYQSSFNEEINKDNNKREIKEKTFEDCAEIGGGKYLLKYTCTGDTNIVIPDYIEAISYTDAFSGMIIKSLIIPDTTTISANVFRGAILDGNITINENNNHSYAALDFVKIGEHGNIIINANGSSPRFTYSEIMTGGKLTINSANNGNYLLSDSIINGEVIVNVNGTLQQSFHDTLIGKQGKIILGNNLTDMYESFCRYYYPSPIEYLGEIEFSENIKKIRYSFKNISFNTGIVLPKGLTDIYNSFKLHNNTGDITLLDNENLKIDNSFGDYGNPSYMKGNIIFSGTNIEHLRTSLADLTLDGDFICNKCSISKFASSSFDNSVILGNMKFNDAKNIHIENGSFSPKYIGGNLEFEGDSFHGEAALQKMNVSGDIKIIAKDLIKIESMGFRSSGTSGSVVISGNSLYMKNAAFEDFNIGKDLKINVKLFTGEAKALINTNVSGNIIISGDSVFLQQSAFDGSTGNNFSIIADRITGTAGALNQLAIKGTVKLSGNNILINNGAFNNGNIGKLEIDAKYFTGEGIFSGLNVENDIEILGDDIYLTGAFTNVGVGGDLKINSNTINLGSLAFKNLNTIGDVNLSGDNLNLDYASLDSMNIGRNLILPKNITIGSNGALNNTIVQGNTILGGAETILPTFTMQGDLIIEDGDNATAQIFTGTEVGSSKVYLSGELSKIGNKAYSFKQGTIQNTVRLKETFNTSDIGDNAFCITGQPAVKGTTKKQITSGEKQDLLTRTCLDLDYDGSYNLVFKVDDNQAIVEYDGIHDVVIPETLRKDGYDIVGWYSDKELTQETDINNQTFGVGEYQKIIYGKYVAQPSGNHSSGGGGGKKSEPSTSEITNDTTQEHNSADDNTTKPTTDTTAPLNEETSKEVISVTQEVADDGTEVEVVVEAVAIKNTNIVATVRTETPVNGTTSSTYSSSTHTQEQADAYSFAKANGITTTESIETAKMNTELTRIQMAKMLSNFAINVLGEEPDVSKGTADFDDVTNKMDEQYDNAVTKAYQLGIMGQNVKDNEFRPNDGVTRAEFTASLSRLLYKTDEGEYKGTSKYYIPHIVKLYNEGIVNKADPKIKEKRGYVMTMLKRTVE